MCTDERCRHPYTCDCAEQCAEIRVVRRTREELGDEAADFIEGILDEDPDLGF